MAWLIHYGVPGMRWGVRNDETYEQDIARQEEEVHKHQIAMDEARVSYYNCVMNGDVYGAQEAEEQYSAAIGEYKKANRVLRHMREHLAKVQERLNAAARNVE